MRRLKRRFRPAKQSLASTSELTTLSCDGCGIVAGWSASSSLVRRQNSRIQVLHCQECARRILVKQCLFPNTTKIDTDQARHEYAVLTRLRLDFPSSDRLGTPVSVEDLSAVGIVVTEFVDGQSLALLLKRARQSEAESPVRMAGSWLRTFHAVYAAGRCKLDVIDKCTSVDRRWVSVSRPRSARDGLYCLAETGPQIEGVTFPRVLLHGDYKAENLLFDGVKIVGLDCGIRHRGAGFYDIAPFLAHIALGARVQRKTRSRSRRSF